MEHGTRSSTSQPPPAAPESLDDAITRALHRLYGGTALLHQGAAGATVRVPLPPVGAFQFVPEMPPAELAAWLANALRARAGNDLVVAERVLRAAGLPSPGTGQPLAMVPSLSDAEQAALMQFLERVPSPRDPSGV